MSKPIKCPRCHGPATTIDKAPPGEKGDVIRCAVEAQCRALTDAAREVEATNAAAADAAAAFVRTIGKPVPLSPRDVVVPAHVYSELFDAVADWKAAGQALHDASRAYGLAAQNAA